MSLIGNPGKSLTFNLLFCNDYQASKRIRSVDVSLAGMEKVFHLFSCS